jgi:hypothetical protein
VPERRILPPADQWFNHGDGSSALGEDYLLPRFDHSDRLGKALICFAQSDPHGTLELTM